MLSLALALGSQASAAIVINEILADPGAVNDANCDGTFSSTQDEFLEIVNTGPAAVDLSGFVVFDVNSALARHTFPAGSTLGVGRAMVVYGGGAATCSVANVVYQVASTASLGLNNTGDAFEIRDLGGVAVASYTYGGEANFDQSITRSPDLDLANPMVQHSTVAQASMSPGTKADGTAFGAPVGTTLSATNPGSAGAQNSWTLTGARPNTLYYMVYSLTPGQFAHPTCPQDPVSMSNPAILTQAQTNGQGAAQFTYAIPAGAVGRTVYFQAGSLAVCDVSNLVTTRF